MAYPRMVDASLRELLGAEFGDAVVVHGRGSILPFPARPVVEVVPGDPSRVAVNAAGYL
jgi:hypothetical protein